MIPSIRGCLQLARCYLLLAQRDASHGSFVAHLLGEVAARPADPATAVEYLPCLLGMGWCGLVSILGSNQFKDTLRKRRFFTGPDGRSGDGEVMPSPLRGAVLPALLAAGPELFPRQSIFVQAAPEV